MHTVASEAPSRRSASGVWMPVVFLIVSFLVSIAFLRVRNIYDDEIGTTDLLPVSTRQIIATMNHTDVHPPGMYVLAHLGYLVIPSARWVTLFPLGCLYLGLSVFVLACAPLFRSLSSRLCFLLFATFHPQLLMWGNSIRWYPWWTGLALITVVVALHPGTTAPVLFRAPRAVALGLLLGCLFYLNYITMIFALAVTAGVVVRYGARVWRLLPLTALITLVLVAPQLHAFVTVHLRGSGEQRADPLLSIARLAQSLLSSEAYLPWHPLAIVAALLFIALAGTGAVRMARRLRTKGLRVTLNSGEPLVSILVVSLVFFTLVAVSGLGGKPRNGLALVPLLAPAVALVVGSLQSRAMRAGVLALIAVWSALGIAHLLRREGLTKSGMNNHPEEVLRFIEASRGGHCSVAITYDPILSFYLVQSRLPRQLVLSSLQNNLFREAAPFDPAACDAINLYVVQSYLGGFGVYETIYPEQLREAMKFVQPPAQVHSFSYDPDAAIKRRLLFIGGTSTLPDYRYLVGSGRMVPSDLKSLEEHLPYFSESDGRSVARLQ